jgi:RNA polymerase-binding transcription factor DksA
MEAAMTARRAVSRHSGRGTCSKLSIAQAETLRALLLAEAQRQAGRLAQCATGLAADSPEDMTSLGRAMDALHMYRARKQIEEIEGALARMEDGGYGICLACVQPIPFEQLQEIPQARFCAACPTPPEPSAEATRNRA